MNDQAKIQTELESRAANITARVLAESVIPEDDHDNYPLAMKCECAKPDCRAQIELNIADRRLLRQNVRQFIIKPGHQDLSLEKVILSSPKYLVVEKFSLSV